MSDRPVRWFSAGVVAAGITAAFFAGSASAWADTGSGDGQGPGSTSSSTSNSTSGSSNSASAGPDTAGPPSTKPSVVEPEPSSSSSTSGQQPTTNAAMSSQLSTPESPTRVSALQITTEKTAKPAPEKTSPDGVQAATSNPAFSLTGTDDESERPESETAIAPRRAANNRTARTQDVKPATKPPAPDSSAKAEPARRAQSEQSVDTVDTAGVDDADGTSAALASRALPQEAAATLDVAPTATVVQLAETPQLSAFAAQAKVPLLNLIGTLVINALSWAVQLFTPPPVIPPGSSVTMGRAQLALPCDCQAVDARWYFPNQEEEPTGVTYLQHGFFRSNANVSALAIQLAEQTNTVVVAPTITSNFFAVGGYWINGDPMHQAVAGLFTDPNRTALQASATAAAIDAGMLSPGQTIDLPDQFVLAGHSAGGNLVAAAAGYIAADRDSTAIDDLRAVIMFDGVDNSGAIGKGVAKLPESVPVYQIASPCSLCNGLGSGTRALENARPGEFVGVLLKQGTHIDAEGASSGFPARLVCGFPRARNVEAVQLIAAGWIIDALHPDDQPIGVYGPLGSTISVPTDAGTATAVVLGHALAHTPADAPHAPVQATLQMTEAA